jgi:hypothetical protein
MLASIDAWRELHLRHSRGEPLSPQEMAEYQQAMSELDAEEPWASSRDLEEARQRLAVLESEHGALTANHDALAREIEHLEELLPLRRVALDGRLEWLIRSTKPYESGITTAAVIPTTIWFTRALDATSTKGDFAPAEAGREFGLRILHPLLDAMNEHVTSSRKMACCWL